MAYQIEIRHDGLNKYRLIKGNDPYVVDQKANAQSAQWEEMWQKRLIAEQKRHAREQNTWEKSEKKQLAIERTDAAQETIAQLEKTLQHTLDVDDAIDWDALKDHGKFSKSKPKEELPLRSDPQYKPKISLFDWILWRIRKRKLEVAERLFQQDYQFAKKAHREKLDKWTTEKEDFLKKQEETNKSIDTLKKKYLAKDPEAIVEYCDLVLSNSQYPDYFPQEFQLDYTSETKMLVSKNKFANLGGESVALFELSSSKLNAVVEKNFSQNVFGGIFLVPFTGQFLSGSTLKIEENC